MAFKFKVWIVVIFLILVLLITVQTNQPNGEVLTDADPIELSQCRAINKGKWCTCRKLQNFVKTKFGKELGLFIPACGRWKPKLYMLKQCDGLKCWCVHPKTGRMKNGTHRTGGEVRSLECKLK